MKKILLVFAAVWLTVSGNAQITADIGVWGGTSMYFGDLDETKPLEPFTPNFGGFFRYNFNSRIGLRAMFLTGNIGDEGIIESADTSFSKAVQDFSLQIEINFLKYIIGVDNMPFSTYLTAGIGVAFFPYDMDPVFIASFNPQHNKGSAVVSESVITPTFPFGIGFKYSIGQRLGIGIEYQMRKMFSDKLDDLDDPLAYITNNNGNEEVIKYTDQIHNNDWSGYLGVHLTYKIYMGKRSCPVYDSKN